MGRNKANNMFANFRRMLIRRNPSELLEALLFLMGATLVAVSLLQNMLLQQTDIVENHQISSLRMQSPNLVKKQIEMLASQTCPLPEYDNPTVHEAELEEVIIPDVTWTLHENPNTNVWKVKVRCSKPERLPQVFLAEEPCSHGTAAKLRSLDVNQDGLVIVPAGSEGYLEIICNEGKLYRSLIPVIADKSSSASADPKVVQDVVLILLSGIAREQAEQVFPETIAFLRQHQAMSAEDMPRTASFCSTEFRRYIAISPLADKNQAAMFAGRGVKQSQSKTRDWIWSRYAREGFRTYVAHDTLMFNESICEKHAKKSEDDVYIPTSFFNRQLDSTNALREVLHHSVSFLNAHDGNRFLSLNFDAFAALRAKNYTSGGLDIILKGYLERLFLHHFAGRKAVVALASDFGTHLFQASCETDKTCQVRTVKALGHAPQLFLWILLSKEIIFPGGMFNQQNRLGAGAKLLQNLVNNGPTLISPYDIFKTFTHFSSDTYMNPVTYGDRVGNLIIRPIEARDCSDEPFSRTLCSCGWSAYCHADRELGRETNTNLEKSEVNRTNPKEGHQSFVTSFAAYLKERLRHTQEEFLSFKLNDKDGASVLCPVPFFVHNKMHVTSCPLPGVLYDMRNRAEFDIRIHSYSLKRIETVHVYAVTGHIERGNVFINNVDLLAERDKSCQASLESLAKQEQINILSKICLCVSDS
eukprot:m.90063 g.90063  ORF g.90063 m.90063 type:complete len:699 (-) comp13255_c0_seq3:2500-4596(-)